MSVASTIAPSESQNLVQVSDLDPETLIRFSGTVVADASAGILQLNCQAPIDKSVLWVYASAATLNASTTDFQYNVLVEGLIVFRHGVEGFQTGGNSLAAGFKPPGILLNPQAPGARAEIQIICDNVLGDNMIGEAFGFIWDAQVGRNLPQKFFWPGTLG